MNAIARRGLLAATAMMALLALPASAADPTAFVSDVKGEVLLNDGGRPPFLGELIPGSRLKLAAGAQAAVMFVVSGEEYALKGPGEFVVGKESITAASGAAPVKRRLAARADSAIIVQASKAGTASLRMRGARPPKAKASGPQYPTGKIAHLDPVLRWNGDASASYDVIVTEVGGKQVHAGPVRGTTLKLPARLAPGHAYAWSVASMGGPPAGARFEVLPVEAVNSAEKARAAAKTFGDRVQLALVLQGLGASEDSKEIWTQLAAERPDVPELAGLARP